MRNDIHIFHAGTDHLDDNDSNAIDARFKLGLNPQIDNVQKLVAAGIVKYTKVAILKDTSNLDLAYERTNSIHGAWYRDNVGGPFRDGTTLLKMTEDDGVRSTSCGDILIHVTDGVLQGYLVSAFGFTALPSIESYGIEI